MADQKLTDRTLQTVLSADDLFSTVDVSDLTDGADGTSKKTKWSLLKSSIDPSDASVEPQGLIEGDVSFANAIINANIINSLITTLTTAGGSIRIPKGLYVVSTSINLIKGVSLRGYGKGVSILKIHRDVEPSAGGDSNENIINIQNPGAVQYRANIEVSNITLNFDIVDIINNGLHGSTWNTRVTTTSLDNIGNCIMIKGDVTNNIYSQSININNCEFFNAGFHGVAAYMRTKELYITNNFASGCYYRAFHVHGDNTEDCDTIIVSDNISDGNGIDGGGSGNGGIFACFYNTKRVIIKGNIVKNDGGVGIHVLGANAGDTICESLIVSNNISEDNAYGGFLLGGGANYAIYSNNISRGNATFGYSFSNTNTTEEFLISNNIAENNNDRGLYVRDSNNGVISGNVIVNNNKTVSGSAFDVEDCKNLVITGNNVFNNGADTPSFVYQFRIQATTLNASDFITVTGNSFHTGANSTAPVISIAGGSTTTPNVSDLFMSNNSIRRTSNPTGATILLLAQKSSIVNNKLYGTVTDTMISSDNTITPNY